MHNGTSRISGRCIEATLYTKGGLWQSIPKSFLETLNDCTMTYPRISACAWQTLYSHALRGALIPTTPLGGKEGNRACRNHVDWNHVDWMNGYHHENHLTGTCEVMNLGFTSRRDCYTNNMRYLYVCFTNVITVILRIQHSISYIDMFFFHATYPQTILQ